MDYVFLRSYGDTEGQLRSDIQQAASSTNIDWDFPALMSTSPRPRHLPPAWYKQMDVGISYLPPVPAGKLALSLNVFNLFNSQTILNAYPYFQISPGTPDPLYGSAVVRQLPRYVRLTVTYDY